MKLISFLGLVSIALAGAAPAVYDSPKGALYVALFTPNAKYSITGTVKFTSNSDGSLEVQVDISNLPNMPVNLFPYHVHVNQVPSNGDCSVTGGHLDPYGGNSSATLPADKLVGDLAGKHGGMVGPSFQTSYIEYYMSLDPSDPAYLGNKRSVVIHDSNMVRLACANIVSLGSVSASSLATTTMATSTTGTTAGMGYGSLLSMLYGGTMGYASLGYASTMDTGSSVITSAAYPGCYTVLGYPVACGPSSAMSTGKSTMTTSSVSTSAAYPYCYTVLGYAVACGTSTSSGSMGTSIKSTESLGSTAVNSTAAKTTTTPDALITAPAKSSISPGLTVHTSSSFIPPSSLSKATSISSINAAANDASWMTYFSIFAFVLLGVF